MTAFTPEEKRIFKYYALFMSLALAAILAITICGCSSMGIARQVKVGNAISMQLDDLHVAIVEACNSGQISEVNCQAITKYFNTVLQTHREYMYSLQALSQGKTTQEQTTFVLSRVQTQLLSLTKMLTDYGVLKGDK